MKKKEKAMNLVNEFKMCKGNMLEECEAFKNSQEKSSETFKYWNNFIEITSSLQFLRADCDGNLASIRDSE